MQVENVCGVILLNLQKYFVGLSTMLIIFSNNPQVFADEVEIFGGEFENQTPPSTTKKPAASAVETPPTEIFNPPVETPAVETPPATVEKPFEDQIPQTTETFNPPADEKSSPATISVSNDEEDFGESLNFDNLNGGNTQSTPAEDLTQNYPERNNGSTNNTTVNIPRENNSAGQSNSSTAPAKQPKMKDLPQRFVQVGVDENYIYYLDKQSVAWKKIPYMNSEYMADVWVRMIERNPSTSDMPEDLANYVSDTNTDEITLARAKGYQYMADDLKVLRHKKYFLEHYYLRPKRDQIQFLAELEVVGHPQNTASQRKYNAQNWEELIPGSMESILYYSIIQVIGKGKADEKGHMTFFDMVEEYARISVR